MTMVSPQSRVVPCDLHLVIDFVNTYDPDERTDELATAAGLQRWLAGRQLRTRAAARVAERDRAQAVALREALRRLMLEHNGAERDPRASRVLERVARDGALSGHFRVEGSAELAPDAPGVPGALAGLLVPVFESMRDGSWRRAKACRASDCGWAFYDRSRNRSGVWCEMAVCGNRAKVRAYRDRSKTR
jgi:predicted RNA-binding Zn ribbon-like protein